MSIKIKSRVDITQHPDDVPIVVFCPLESQQHTGNKSAESPRPHWVSKEWGVPTSAGQISETAEKEGGAL